MKEDILKGIWKKTNNIKQYTKEELEQLLEDKMKEVMKQYLTINLISIITGLIVVVLLIISALNRLEDRYYVVHNIALSLLTLIITVSGIYSYYRMKYNKFELPLREWLRYRINAISKSLKWYPVKYIFPLIICVPYYLSFFIYFVKRPFISVIQSEKFYFGYILVFIGISLSSFLVLHKIKNDRNKDLMKLKNLYDQLIKKS